MTPRVSLRELKIRSVFFDLKLGMIQPLKAFFQKHLSQKKRTWASFAKLTWLFLNNVLLDAEIFSEESRKKFLIILFQEIVRRMVKKWLLKSFLRKKNCLYLKLNIVKLWRIYSMLWRVWHFTPYASICTVTVDEYGTLRDGSQIT